METGEIKIPDSEKLKQVQVERKKNDPWAEQARLAEEEREKQIDPESGEEWESEER